MSYLDSNPMYVLNLYNHPYSEDEFSNTIVPNLKHSLSLTLKHYLPVAGNLLYPLDTDASKSVICYVSGDTVSLTIAISNLDFDDLVLNHAREADQFYDHVQPQAPLTEEENYKIAPVICIGVNFHHGLCYWRSIVGLVKAWTMINKSGDDEAFVAKTG
ncbi:malonyl-coenzyme:anthocyanin 5-O-glucoside-6'''-O-malonyltransferase-like [Salvia splendens]|uniref:malonyl-coenzyme:anthocyanin 5-O-glucoside-6'''-O-malonyltransferase-like n=1 Tax=Salvia splendens TaxID=180675 RepID=UPI001C2742EC|nr:malonyl-coenzyme:anthocyanin 5-O-glucoside-6'''-O-malonyltransferase-like [Salvia splendens]